MTARDYGAVRARGAGRVFWIVVALGLLPVAALYGHDFLIHRAQDIGVAKAWAIDGPPCPALTAGDFAARGFKVRSSFDYDGIAIGRHSGHVSCSDVKQGGGTGLFIDRVCQFTSPQVITVTSKAGAFYFVPGVGQPASIVIHDGKPRCVMASKYTLKTS